MDSLSFFLFSFFWIDEESQGTALRWVNEFILLAPSRQILPFAPSLLASILPSLSSPVSPIRNAAVETNGNLYRLVLETPLVSLETEESNDGLKVGHGILQSKIGLNLTDKSSSFPGGSKNTASFKEVLDVRALVLSVSTQVLHMNEETRVMALEWLAMIHR